MRDIFDLTSPIFSPQTPDRDSDILRLKFCERNPILHSVNEKRKERCCYFNQLIEELEWILCWEAIWSDMGDFVRLWKAICHDFGDMLSYAPPSPTQLEETLLSSPLFVSVSSYRIYVEKHLCICINGYMDIWYISIVGTKQYYSMHSCKFLLSLNKNIQMFGLPVPNMKKRQYAWMMVPWQKCDDEAKWRNVMQTLILRNSCQPPGETFRSCD